MKITWLAFIILISTAAFSQSIEPFNSGQVIEKAIKYHDQKEYQQAIKVYKTIPRNDTNYSRALYEMALSYSLDSNYTEALKTCDAVLEQEDRAHELNALILKGSILDNNNENSKALKIYDSALLKYPNSQNLLLNKAISLIRVKRIEEAEKILEDLVLVNPYYSSAHMKLATCALQRGRIVPAMMSLFTYLLIHPDGSFYNTAIKLLDNISKNTQDVTEAIEIRKRKEEVFSQAEQIILSGMALDNKYKLQSDLDDPIVRQLQAVMEVVQYDQDNNDFWMQYYVPLFKNIFSNKMLEPAVHQAFSNVALESVQRYIKKNGKTIKEAVSELVTYLNLIRSTKELNFTKRQHAPRIYYYEDNLLYAKGKLDDKEKAMGEWEYYHSNGNLKSKGLYNIEGKQQGKWEFYFFEGTLNGREEWNNGMRTGLDVSYNQKGNVITRANYLNDKLNGKKETFYATGNLQSISFYKEDSLEGSYIEFYSTGQKHIEATYVNNKLHNIYKSYYGNGKPEIEAIYNEGDLNGPYKTYYDNGSLSFESFYNKGVINGPVKLYHRNGKLKEIKSLQNDNIIGEVKEYNGEGTLVSNIFYENGLANGLAKYYDDDGKLYSTFLFEKDVLKEAKYFDKTGNEISFSIRKNKSLDLDGFSPQGFKSWHAVYNNENQKTGKHSFFYNSGKIKETNDYTNGLLEGYSIGYYENGAKQYEIAYKADEKNGPAIYYYPSGNVKSKGWYTADVLSGDWENYNEKQKLTSRYSYLNGDLTGHYEVNYVNGKKDYEEVYYRGWLTALHTFDTAGKIISTAKFINGKGNYTALFPNGQKKFECSYVNDELHGIFTSYYFDGSLRIKRNYFYGQPDEEYTDYHYGGQIATKGSYKFGKRIGVWKYYSNEGKLWKEENYIDDKVNGTTMYYHPNGKPEYEIQYKEDLRNGTYKQFSDDGQLIIELHFKEDEITGYTYNGNDGKLVPFIALPGGIGKVYAFYSNGTKSLETEYTDGKSNGSFKIYYPNGKIMYQRQDLYGLTNGKLVEYYADGNPKSEYNYFLDNYDGPYKEYYENGKVKEEGKFYNGYQNGEFSYYDENGKLKSKKHFYYGMLINVTK